MDSPSQSRSRKRRRHQQASTASAVDAAADADPEVQLSPSESKKHRDALGQRCRLDAVEASGRGASPLHHDHRDQPVASTSAQPILIDLHGRPISPSSLLSPRHQRLRLSDDDAASPQQHASHSHSHSHHPLFALPPAQRGARAAMMRRDQERNRNAIDIVDNNHGDEDGHGQAQTNQQGESALVQQLRAELELSRKEVQSKNELIESQRSALDYIHGQASCTICLELAWRPHVLCPCGHVFCARCLVEWFQGPQSPDRGGNGQTIDNELALAREKICPHCRSFVRGLPAEVWALKGMVERLDAAQKLGHILTDGAATTGPPRSASEEAHMRGDDLPPGSKIWEPFFESDGQREPILDESDGVWRCGNCSCEIWKRECTGCGRNHHAFFVSRGIFDGDDGGDSEYGWDDGSDAGTFTTGNLHGPESPGPWMDAEHATSHLGMPYDPEEEEDAEDGDGDDDVVEDNGSDLIDFIDDDVSEGGSSDGDGGSSVSAMPPAFRSSRHDDAHRGAGRRYGYSDDEDGEDGMSDGEDREDGYGAWSGDEDDLSHIGEGDDDDDEDEDDIEPIPAPNAGRAARRLGGRSTVAGGSGSGPGSTSRPGSSRRPITVPDDLDTDESDSDSDSDSDSEDGHEGGGEGEARWIGDGHGAGAGSTSGSRRTGHCVCANHRGLRRRAAVVDPSDEEDEDEESDGERDDEHAHLENFDESQGSDSDCDSGDDEVIRGGGGGGALPRRRRGYSHYRVVSDSDEDEGDAEEGHYSDE